MYYSQILARQIHHSLGTVATSYLKFLLNAKVEINKTYKTGERVGLLRAILSRLTTLRFLRAWSGENLSFSYHHF